jgi:hypothetical protein
MIASDNDTGDNISPVSMTPVSIIAGVNASGAFLFTIIVDTGDKFIASVVVTGDNCSPVSLISGKMLSPVSLSPAIIVHRCR